METRVVVEARVVLETMVILNDYTVDQQMLVNGNPAYPPMLLLSCRTAPNADIATRSRSYESYHHRTRLGAPLTGC